MWIKHIFEAYFSNIDKRFSFMKIGAGIYDSIDISLAGNRLRRRLYCTGLMTNLVANYSEVLFNPVLAVTKAKLFAKLQICSSSSITVRRVPTP